MSFNYPIIETQLRLIRALQRGYAEALEAGDWQMADYRAAHLHKLCEGLHHLSQLLDRGHISPEGIKPKSSNNWVNTLRSVPSHFPQSHPLMSEDKFTKSPLPLPEITPEQLNEE